MYIKSISNDLRSRYDQVSKLVDFCRQYLARCPEGRLRINRRGDLIYYYHVILDGKPGGIRINTREQAETLAQKSYMACVLKVALEEQKALQQLINLYVYNSIDSVYESLNQDRRDLIKPISLPDGLYVKNWLEKPYTPASFKDGTPVYMTMKGERVRSKSEVMIADRLYVNGIPYKYECPLQVGNEVFHPDFTILRVSDRTEIYYEHLGRMDDPGYASYNVYRINKYARNGYIPGVKLFTTMESSDHPLDIRVVDDMINELFK